MAGKPKAKRKPKLTDKAQSERFKQTARKLGIGDDAKPFEHAVQKILRPKRIIPTR